MTTPKITSLAPTSGRAGDSVVITGEDLATTGSVWFTDASKNTQDAEFTMHKDHSVTTTVPDLMAAGTGSVFVELDDTDATSSDPYTFTIDP
ncbi:IPT/TIG domain-containing protein [Streptomyces lavenduligriseus]|uniref:IPT/TIG domain-containing protein n=1 Tax=Streptomyces lavenduligriseus TaxID=67315 RepID=A0ABT0P374_9ACTN|nr:IPT/TIG domain-containing protein [Streptomyces lavenduligriseus]MCL3998195.1 IPT/TIG domain-containing protein [Streptomyces lavenduligriseus]